MSDQDTINRIRAYRNTALDALEDTLISIDLEIEQTPSDNIPYLKQLNVRRQNIINERENIMDIAAATILSLPSVVAVAKRLNEIASEMKSTAEVLPNSANKLNTISEVLSLGQQFTDLIANAQKPDNA